MAAFNLIKTIKTAMLDSFLRATIWMFLGTGVLSFGNYLYHLVMGRMLGPSEYGILESIISISYILSVPLLTLNLIIVKYVSSYKGKGDLESVSSFYRFLNKRFLREGVIICLVLILLSPLITSFLHLSSYTFTILLVSFIFVGLFAGLGRGTLQGMTNFFGLAVANATETVVKLTVAILLVYLGLKAQGGLIGIVVSVLLAYGATRFFLSKVIDRKAREFGDLKLIGKYTLPTFFTTLALTSLFTTDVLLARHFLAPEIAGYYAALSVLGKVVFFAVSPVSLVMFPFVSEKHAKGENFSRIIFLSAVLTTVGSLIVVLIYYLFPDLVVLSLFGKHFLPISPFTAQFGLFIGIYSLCYLVANFYLSIHRSFPTIFVTIAAIFQIVCIYLFHKDISQIISINIGISFLLIFSLLLYYPHVFRKQ